MRPMMVTEQPRVLTRCRKREFTKKFFGRFGHKKNTLKADFRNLAQIEFYMPKGTNRSKKIEMKIRGRKRAQEQMRN